MTDVALRLAVGAACAAGLVWTARQALRWYVTRRRHAFAERMKTPAARRREQLEKIMAPPRAW